jgi:hypothetical protein
MLKKLVVIIIQTHLTLESCGRSYFFAKSSSIFCTPFNYLCNTTLRVVCALPFEILTK